MGGCDFSVKGYTYDDVPGDVELKHFNLTEDDLLYKVHCTSSLPQLAMTCNVVATEHRGSNSYTSPTRSIVYD